MGASGPLRLTSLQEELLPYLTTAKYDHKFRKVHATNNVYMENAITARITTTTIHTTAKYDHKSREVHATNNVNIENAVTARITTTTIHTTVKYDHNPREILPNKLLPVTVTGGSKSRE
eukprot:2943601-Pleurochrysis_carterae.AAC.2